MAAAISEFVLRGLRLKLPAGYRLPYYGQLAVLFLYPLWLLPTLTASDAAGTTWRIFAFPFVVGLSILTLWPAVRRGPQAVANNGSPWRWGWYPWTLFVFLGFCLCLRCSRKHPRYAAASRRKCRTSADRTSACRR